MADDGSRQSAPGPLPTFGFALRFAGQGTEVDSVFSEVSGIGSEWQLEPVEEGGENRFHHQLPRAAKLPLLTLKRGAAALDSGLVKWCRGVLEGGLTAAPVPTRDLELTLLGPEGKPLRQWAFTQAYPVNWRVEPFASKGQALAIETIELAYTAVHLKT